MREGIITEVEHGVTLEFNRLKVSYLYPSITPSTDEEQPINSIDDARYFYYTFEVKKGKKVLFKADVYDNPNVLHMPYLIDLIIGKDTAIIDSIVNGNNTKTVHFARTSLTNFSNQECFCIIEKYIVDRTNNGDTETEEFYTLTFGEHPNIFRDGYSNKHCCSNDISFRWISREELLDFKRLAEEFFLFAVKYHNTELTKYLNGSNEVE